jgi:hypothetical protein
MKFTRRVAPVGAIVALALACGAYLGLRLEDNSPLAAILILLSFGMIVCAFIVLLAWRTGAPLSRPQLPPWATAGILALAAFGVFNACSAEASLPVDGQAAITNGQYVIQAHGAVVRAITQAEYDRETNLELHLFAGSTLFIWAAVTMGAFALRSRPKA